MKSPNSSLKYIFNKVRKLKNRGLNRLFYLQKLRNKLIIQRNLKKGVFAVEIISYMGLGANLIWALEIMAFCNEKGLTPQFKFTAANSKEKEDNFGNYFSIKNSSRLSGKFNYAKIRNFQDLNLDYSWNYNSVLNMELAQELLDKYLIINDDIKSEVNTFCERHFANKSVLGVHFRGTDKKSEAPLLSYKDVLKNIEFYIARYATDLIFISSDDENFINYIESSTLNIPVVYNDDSFRSNDHTAIHSSGKNLYDINRDALINCLLLSRCDALMKTASILSAWSKLFNPELPLVMLTEPYKEYRYFPEKELAKDVLFQPLI